MLLNKMTMILETDRLKIAPLTVEQFQLLLSDVRSLEGELELAPSNEELDDATEQAMKGLLEIALNHPDKYLWYTYWLIILKSENKVIGGACFTREPDENGQVEIGYGTNMPYRNKGYMTEAIKAITGWALLRTEVKTIIAETESTNYASHKVLINCSMVKYIESGDSIWWKLE